MDETPLFFSKIPKGTEILLCKFKCSKKVGEINLNVIESSPLKWQSSKPIVNPYFPIVPIHC